MLCEKGEEKMKENIEENERKRKNDRKREKVIRQEQCATSKHKCVHPFNLWSDRKG
jgi:hypothetical protein